MSNEQNNGFPDVIKYFLQNEFSKEMYEKIYNYDEEYEEKDKDELIRYCINKAWNDAMIYEKYSKKSNLKDKKDDIKENLIEYINNNNRESQEIILKPKELFEKTSQELGEKGLKFVTYFQGEDNAYFGVFQKFINMSMKYLICVNDKLNLGIDFMKCDVPIDSFILDWCRQVIKDGEQINLKNVVWNNLNIEAYIEIQQGIRAYVGEINKKISPRNISPLELEFYIWPIMKLQRAINQFNNAVSEKEKSDYNPFSENNIKLVGLSDNLNNDFIQFIENTKKINT